ncbi:MAG TPA: acetamidase/formamidase family protein [Bryobacteraceae bacterium]|nr:acetamidase/formamidase family protein [Bryobacteraceae bacterium]
MRFLFTFCILAPAILWSQPKLANPSQYYRTFSHTNPVFLRIKPGDVVATKTVDSGGMNDKGQQATEGGNPLTGPFYIDGAQPGDAILVHLRMVRLNRNWGSTSYRLGLFSLSADSIESTYPNHYKADVVRKGRDNILPWDIDLKANTVRLREPVSGKVKLEFPVRPMLGCIGVAAPGDFSPTSGPSGSYGGNLDYNEIAEGATVILPVYHPGALLFMGDGHALMADGEPTGTGVETSMDVEFSVDVKKNAHVNGPRVETSEYLISMGAQPEFVSSLDRALQVATTDMVRWLTGDFQLEPWAAHQLIGAVGKYDVVTVAGSMALKIPKKYLVK